MVAHEIVLHYRDTKPFVMSMWLQYPIDSTVYLCTVQLLLNNADYYYLLQVSILYSDLRVAKRR